MISLVPKDGKLLEDIMSEVSLQGGILPNTWLGQASPCSQGLPPYTPRPATLPTYLKRNN